MTQRPRRRDRITAHRRSLGLPPAINIAKNHCWACAHDWVPRVARPKGCPSCHSYSWWIEREPDPAEAERLVSPAGGYTIARASSIWPEYAEADD